MQKRLFIHNGIILALTSLIIRSMGMVFRIFLNDTIGAEGIGLYQLVLSVYMIFVLVSSSGISLCTTRLYADNAAVGNFGKARWCTERIMLLSFLSGLVLSCMLYFSAEPIAVFLLNDSRAAPALKILSPSLPFLAVSACVRGYFLARRKTLPTSGEQLLEQILEIGIFLSLFSLYRPHDLTEACCMTVIGTTAAEVLSFVYSLICYHYDKKKLSYPSEKTEGLVRKMLPIFLPVTANACLRSGLSAAENALIPFGLERYGLSAQAALSQYGIISGMSMTVLVFPSVAILPFAMLIVPEIAEARVSRRSNAIRHITETMIVRALQFAVPVMVIFIFYGVPLCRLLFKNDEAGKYLCLLAPVIPFMYLDSVVDSILKGLNEQTGYFIFNTIDSVIRVILTALLLPFFGISGVIAVIIISELLNTLMSLARLIQVTKIKLPLFRAVILPLIIILIPCLMFRIIPAFGSEMTDVIIKILCCGLFYISMHFADKMLLSGKALKS